MRRKQQARTAATVHISFWIDGPPGLPLKQTATFQCEEDALRFLQQRKSTGRQHGEPGASTAVSTTDVGFNAGATYARAVQL